MRGIQTGLALALALGITSLDSPTTQAATGRQTLPGHVPAIVQTLQPVGPMDGTTRLNLAIGLPLHNLEVMTNLLQQILDPHSPQYHQYLTPEQFTAQFGPPEADYQALLAFAQANNFTVTATYANRRMLDVSATAADINAAFGITLQTYHHPTENRDFFATPTEPAVDAGAPILDISGLNNYQLAKPRYHSPVPAGPVARAGSHGGVFAGTDYRSAYAPGVTLDGTGQSLGLLEFDGFHATDITGYRTQTGIVTPAIPIQTILLDGYNGTPTGSGGEVEVALDIEMAISMAPGLTKVVVFEAGPSGFANDMLTAMTTNSSIKQFSCSWGFPTSTPRATMDSLFQTMILQGQGFYSASGDSGAEPGGLSPPDDDPYLTSVGGTALATTGPAGGAWLYENTWDIFQGEGSSGGYSSTYSIPTWQQVINMSTNGGSATTRNIPDVAAIADNIFIVADSTAQITGGTSCAAPLWAAFSAMANQQALANGNPVIGFINPAIYALVTGPGYSACFDDVTVGNNDNGNGTAFQAVPGYDLCTGLGSMTGSSLINALATPDGFYITAGRGFAANGPVGGPFTITSQTLTLTNAGTNSFTWQISAPPSWLGLSATSGTLTPGGAAASVTASLTPAAAKLAAGVYTATLHFTKLSGGSAQIRQFTVIVGEELTQDGGFESGDFDYWPLAGANAFEVDPSSGAPYTFVDDGTSGIGMTPHSGSYYAALGAAGTPLATISQTIPTLAGQIYVLSYWLQSVDVGGGTTPSEFQVTWNGSIVSDQVNLGVFGWTKSRFIVAGAPTSSVLTFGFQDDNSWLGLDDISVQALALPTFQKVSATNNIVSFTWSAVSGQGYQLQYKTSLTPSGGWNNLGSPITAAGATVSTTDNNPPDPERFYRVQLIPH